VWADGAQVSTGKITGAVPNRRAEWATRTINIRRRLTEADFASAPRRGGCDARGGAAAVALGGRVSDLDLPVRDGAVQRDRSATAARDRRWFSGEAKIGKMFWSASGAMRKRSPARRRDKHNVWVVVRRTRRWRRR
jgi:hypothetical protein